METDSLYISISDMSISRIIRPELYEEYDNGIKDEFLSTLKYHDRTLGLFKAEFQGTRMIAFMSKCYYAEDAKSRTKFSCKDVSKKQNYMSWERYLEALNRSIDMATNTGFRVHCHAIVTYAQDKLCPQRVLRQVHRIVAPSGIHTEPLR